MRKLIYIFLFVGFCILPAIATAADYAGPVQLVGGALQQATTSVMTQLTGMAFKLLFYFSLLKLTILGIGQIRSGDIEMSIAKFASAFLWLGAVVWIMSPAAAPVRDGLSNGANYIQGTIDYFLGFASTLTGGNGSSFDSGDVLNVGLTASHKLIFAVAKATAGNLGNAILAVALPSLTIFTALMLMVMNLIVLLSCGYIALKVFMVKLDAAVVIAISPLSFSLMGLDALKEQGLAPFKNLITIIYRIVILAAIVSAMNIVSDFLTTILDTTASGGMEDIWTPIMGAIFGYILLAYLAHRSDAIAQSLSTGSSMFSSGDMASSVAAGVAVGMAAVTGGAAVAGAAGKAGQPMSDVIKSMMGGGGGSVANASPTGTGGTSNPPPPAKTPEMSLKQMQDHPSNIANQEDGAGGARFSSSPSSGPAPGSATSTPSSPVSESSAPPTTHSGSGSNAGIGGSGGTTDEKLDKLIDSMGQPKKSTFGERMSAVNDHVAKEQTTVQASINVNAHDH